MNDDYRKLRNQPLTCVLSEIRFSEVLKIGDHIPDIQEAIRKTYPLIKQNQQKTIQIGDQGVAVGMSSEWVFNTPDLQSAVMIGTDRLVFITSKYDRFPDFKKSCLELIAVVKRIIDPTLLLRVGLRYNDCIEADDLSHLAAMVDTRFLPSDNISELGSTQIHYRTEVSVFTQEGRLVVKSFLGKHNMMVMPDLSQSLPIKLGENNTGERLALLLDFDHFWTAEKMTENFALETVDAHLQNLHETARAAFWRTTTIDARERQWS